MADKVQSGGDVTIRPLTPDLWPALEAYPCDGAVSPSASSTGYLSSFERAGFKVVARRSPARPIVRLDLAARA